MNYTWAGRTDIGRQRTVNQDSVLPDDVGLGPGPVVVAVADGLGAYEGSEVASRLAVETIATAAVASSSPSDLVALAGAAIADHIDAVAVTRPQLANMSTTLTLAVLRGDGIVEIGHVGDSRGYRWDGTTLTRLTTDHTVAMDMVRAGVLSADDAPRHPAWHTMSNWLGRGAEFWVETHEMVLGNDERLLLCSDGLSNMIGEDVIAALLSSGTPDEASSALVAAANEAGGSDNISVVVVAIEP